MLNNNDIINTFIGSSVALVGGIVSYLVTAKQYTLRDLFVKAVSSGFVGLLAGLLCIYSNMPESMTFFACGTFGYLGSEISIALLKKYLENKLIK